MDRKVSKQSHIVRLDHNPNQSQGNHNKYNNTNDETKDVDDSDKSQSREDQNEPKEKLLENKSDKKIDASNDNPDAKANSKVHGDLINCNNETPNINEYEVSIDDL